MRKLFVIIPVVLILISGVSLAILMGGGDDNQAKTPTPPGKVPIGEPITPAVPDSSAAAETTQTPQSQTPAQTEALRIAAVGDAIPHDTVNLRAEKGSDYDYTQYYSRVQSFLDDSDVLFCNQEAPTGTTDSGIAGYPSFKAPKAFSRDLHAVGCDLVNLANNHTADQGQAGINATIANWKNLDSTITGANSSQAQQDEIAIREVNGTKVAFIAFTDLSNNTAIESYSINMFTEALVKKLTTKAASLADIVVVSAHWGVENSATVSADQKKWAKLLADNGADVIIGTGPHVLQPVDILTNADKSETTVFYSIGNFLSSQLQLEELIGGIAYIDLPLDGSTPTLSFLPTYMSYTWTATEETAQNLLARDNLSIYPLKDATEVLKASRLGSSAATQLNRVTGLLNQNVTVTILEP